MRLFRRLIERFKSIGKGLARTDHVTVKQSVGEPNMVLGGSDANTYKAQEGDSFLARGSEFSGVITHRGQRFVVDGQCSGMVRQTRRDSELLMNPGSNINGELHASSIQCQGRLSGQIKARDVVIGAKGSISGEVEYGTIEILGQLDTLKLTNRSYSEKTKTKGVTHI